jgi:soluble lytic murein transglycosylase-like protein
MSVTILPYIDDQTTQALREATQTAAPTTMDEAVESFQSVLDNATRAQQAMAVDALLAANAAGSLSMETVQKLLGFDPTDGTAVETAETSDETVEAADETESTETASTTTASLDSYFEEAAETYNVDVKLLKAIAKAESNFDASATSSAGAMGIMQLMPSTAKSLGISDAYDAHDNIMGGAKVISQLLEKYDGDKSLALAAYNAGSGNVDKYGGIPPFTETQNYVKKVLSYYSAS